jgi:hypothetical protein
LFTRPFKDWSQLLPGSWRNNFNLQPFSQKFVSIILTFYNISDISWRSVLLVEETGVPGENHRPVANHRQTVSHIAWAGFELTTLAVIGTDCTGSYKSNYHTISNKKWWGYGAKLVLWTKTYRLSKERTLDEIGWQSAENSVFSRFSVFSGNLSLCTV